MKDIQIANKKIGINSLIFLIAEAGVNHNGKLSIAKKLVDVAAKANVDAIKFQTFNAEKLLLKSTTKVKYQKENSDDKESFYEMIKKYELTIEEFRNLKDYCAEKKLIFLSTPFDEVSVELLEDLNVPAYKIGSGDMNNFPLLKLICRKKKPIFLSTGMASLEEVKKSVNFIKSNKSDDLVILQCTTSYPTPLEDVNLNVIDLFKQEFPDDLIGFSDHTLGFEASIGAATKGVKVIERHITLDKEMEGPDHKASIDPEELKKWVKSIRNLEKILGSSQKEPSKTELEIARIVRKSIVTIKDFKKGDVLTKENISIKRPGYDISPVNYEKIIGKKVKKDIPKDSLIFWDDLE